MGARRGKFLPIGGGHQWQERVQSITETISAYLQLVRKVD